MFPRAATRDAARVLDFDYGVGDRLAKMIPDPIQGRPPSFADCLKEGEELAVAYRDDEQARKVIDAARGHGGIGGNAGIHAAGAGPTVDPRLESITAQTYGVILYQEQAMQIAKSIAGFTGPQADDLRKAIGKKDRQKMAGMKDLFVEGARKSGTAEGVIQTLWSVNEASADYSFNRSHAAC